MFSPIPRPNRLYRKAPSSLDAVAFGHLAIHLFAPMPRPNRLETALRKHPNLCDFVDRISSRQS
ncbi:hypothetical protein T484DRAFT_1823453 [Baffinella frigidus]|nr:hypothetical protein T484DRAFT_1823453 [Cryptophyta sp. CCMP2293]